MFIRKIRYIFFAFFPLLLLINEALTNDIKERATNVFTLEGFISYHIYDNYPHANYSEIVKTINRNYERADVHPNIYKYLLLTEVSLRYGNTANVPLYWQKLNEYLQKKNDSIYYEKVLSNYLWGKYVIFKNENEGKRYFNMALNGLDQENLIQCAVRDFILVELAGCYIKMRRITEAEKLIRQVHNKNFANHFLIQKHNIILQVIDIFQNTNEDVLDKIEEPHCKSQILKAELELFRAYLFNTKGDIIKGENHLDVAEKIYAKSNIYSGYVQSIHYMKSIAHLQSGDIKEAERYLKNILLNKKRVIYSFLAPYEITYLKAKIHYGKNEYAAAEDAFKLLLKEASGTIYHVYGLINLGVICTMNKKYNEAREYFDRAGFLIRKNEIYENARMFYYISLAYYYYSNPYADDKIRVLQELYDRVRDKSRYYKRIIESYIGGYYIEQGKYSDALPYFEKASSQLMPQMDEKYEVDNEKQEVYGSNDLYCILSLAICKYFNYKNENHDINELISSFDIYKYLIERIEDNFKYLVSDDEKLKYLAKYYIQLDNAINVGYILYKQTGNVLFLHDIANLTQKSKAYVLRSAINDKTAKIYSGIPQYLIKYENDLKEKILELTFNYQLNENQNIPAFEMGQLDQHIFNLHEEHKTLIDKFEREYPKYYKLKYEMLDIRTDSIHNLLKENQALIDYYHAFNGLYIFIYTKDQLHVYCASLPLDALDFLKNFRNNLSGYDYGDFSFPVYKDFIDMSYKSYQLFIEPINQYLSGIDHLIIIPDKEINLVPFELFISDTANFTGQLNYRDLPYLLKQYTITYSYSASFIHSDIRKIINPDLLAFSPTYTLSEKKPKVGQYENLPGALSEIEKITNYFFSKTITGKKADKKYLIDNSTRYDIIHLALHTELDDNKPVYSRFVFSNENMEKDLFVYEIYNQNFKSDLIVLSGCNTGSGKLNQGEGILSLARSFIYNGVSSMVLTQWAIEDNSSAELMEYFYSALSSGMRSDEALRLAKLRYLKEADPVKIHPFYWAGFIHFGNPVIVKKRMISTRFILSASIILIIAGSIVVIRRIILR